ncbi:hypothetical protein VTN77DRAFT_5987 [Rasamsonia byssochlamydoides]|uniref:uncharacterized protein n=1 Tax=Rasamsonia byssochlamydoides TaxID=89139 RepID=UPI0037434CCF
MDMLRSAGLPDVQLGDRISKDHLAFLRELQSQIGAFEVQAKLLQQLAAEENRLKGLGGETCRDSGTDILETRPLGTTRPTNQSPAIQADI